MLCRARLSSSNYSFEHHIPCWFSSINCFHVRRIMQNAQGGQPPLNFGSFKEGFSTGMNFLKRRFSSSDLADDVTAEAPPAGSKQPPQGPPPAGYASRPDQGFSLQGLTNKMSSTISAPTSPAKAAQGAAGGQSMYSQVQGLTKNIFQAATGHKEPQYNRERCKCLLVVDDYHTDWSKYFRSKKILGDWDLRIEQAEFSEISLSSFSDTGCLVDLHLIRGGAKVTRSLQPDFILIRQPVRTESQDWKKVVIGLLYGGVPSLNSLHSIYNFLDKPWVYAHLLMIQRRLSKEKFPLIDQTFYPTHREMIKINNAAEFQDISSVVGVSKEYCTVEPFVESKYDIHVQKIGANYKAFMRKGISGHWKANLGSAMLEQIAMTERYRQWIDEVAQLFGGLDICAVEAIVAKDGKEVIYEVNDCSFALLGETQEEDRRTIAELALQKMTHILSIKQALISATRRESATAPGSTAPQNFIKHESPSYQQRQAQPAQHTPPHQPVQPPTQPVQQRPQQPTGSAPQAAPAAARPQPQTNPFLNEGSAPPPQAAGAAPIPKAPGAPGGGPPGPSGPPRGPPPPRPPRLPSQASKDGGGPTVVDATAVQPAAQPAMQPGTQPTAQTGMQPSSQVPASAPQQQGELPRQTSQGEDTMSNLRKTFAGIFGDM